MQNDNSLAEQISAIVTASRDQAERLREINQTVVSLDQMTQQKAAMVEETSTAASELDSEMHTLGHRINYFIDKVNIENRLRLVK